MTYDPDQEYKQNLEYVLKKIRGLHLHAAEGAPLEFKISTVIASGYPSGKQERQLLAKLTELDVIDIHSKQWFKDDFKKSPFYLLKLGAKFDDFYRETVLKESNQAIYNKENIIESDKNYKYDIVFSLAGEQKELGNEIKRYIDKSGLRSWIYTEHQAELVGKNQAKFFAELFGKDAKYCVSIVSEEYLKKIWTSFEGEHIINRWMKEIQNYDYLIPLSKNGKIIEGYPDIRGYLSIDGKDPQVIAHDILTAIDQSYQPSPSKPDFYLPKQKKHFNPLSERKKWIELIIDELKRRSQYVSGLEVEDENLGDKQLIVVSLANEVIYSLKIFKSGLSNDDGISFGVCYGRPTTNGGQNAFGEFKWSKEKAEIVLDITDLSFLGENRSYSKEEFIETLWMKIAKQIEEIN